MNEELPNGWGAAALSDLVYIMRGGDWGTDPADALENYENVRVVRGTDFKTWHNKKATGAAIRAIKTSSLEKRRLQDGDIVLEVSGGGPDQPVGRTVLIDKDTLKAELPTVCSNFFRFLRLYPQLDSRFVNYFLQYEYGRGSFNEFQTQTTNLRNLNVRAFVDNTLIALAPSAEQRRIAAQLELLLPAVDACRQRLGLIPNTLKRFRQAVLAAACSGRLTADWRAENPNAKPYAGVTSDVEAEEEYPPNWNVSELGALTALVTSGSRGWAKYYAVSGSTFIRAQNINADFLNLKDIAFVRPPISAEGLRTKVQRHDILITITGANVTKSALVEAPVEDAYVSQHVALVRLTDIRLAKFLFYFIISPAHGRKQLLAAAYGQGKPELNLANVREVLVALPPIPEQEEIVRRVRVLFEVADRIAERYIGAKKQVDNLSQSILGKAFRGELLPQDPNDEPVERLLERLKVKDRAHTQE